MPYANIGGVAINYEILGRRGPSMALSPGGRNPYAHVMPIAERMAAKGYRVLLHDRRNCGASDASFDPSRSEYEVWADDLDDLLTQFDMAPAIIGGSSSGARLALTFALALSAVGAGAAAVARHRRRLRGEAARRAILRPVRPPGGRGRDGRGLRRGAFRRADPQPAVQSRAADGDRSEGVHQDHAGLARAVRGGRGAAADRDQRGRPAFDPGADLHHSGQRSHPRQRDRRDRRAADAGLRGGTASALRIRTSTSFRPRNGTRWPTRSPRSSTTSWRASFRRVSRRRCARKKEAPRGRAARRRSEPGVGP